MKSISCNAGLALPTVEKDIMEVKRQDSSQLYVQFHFPPKDLDLVNDLENLLPSSIYIIFLSSSLTDYWVSTTLIRHLKYRLFRLA